MKINIPIVFQIKAESVEEAENIAMRFIRVGGETAIEYEPKTFKAVRGYGPGQFRLRIRKDEK